MQRERGCEIGPLVGCTPDSGGTRRLALSWGGAYYQIGTETVLAGEKEKKTVNLSKVKFRKLLQRHLEFKQTLLLLTLWAE